MSNTFQTLVIRPKISLTDEDPVTKALGVYKMSKFAGCPDNFIGAAIDRTTGRRLTGLDENAPSVLALPQEERIVKQKEILEERAFLEKELGVDLHHTNSAFWESLDMTMDNGKILSLANPLDRVKYHAIVAGKILPLSKDEANNPEFKGINFYVGKEYEDVDDKNRNKARERQIARKLDELLENFDYSVEIGKYLQIAGVSPKMPKANIEDLLTDFVEKKKGNADLFLEAVKETREFINLSNKFKEFRAKKLVEFSNGKFYSGKVALGKTEKDSVKKLLGSNPEMQAELARLMEEVNEK
jgi:hypothetical protein